MIIIEKYPENKDFRVILQPNRSISWPLLLRFYCFTCVVSFSMATLFSLLGYWMVWPFSGLEMMLLGAGLYVTSRDAHRQEIVKILDSRIRIEKGRVELEESHEFDLQWVTMKVEETPGWRRSTRLLLGSHGHFVEIGNFLNPHEKESLAFELNQSILTNGFLRSNR